MTKMTSWIRKNLGMIISSLGIILLVILTFGDMGELFTEKYWENVGGNLSSIGALSIGLVLIQTSIKQGVSEQALSAGLNTPDTTQKYKDHKDIRDRCQEKEIYLPYFLSIRNDRETKRRKREFLVDNGFTNEKMLRLSRKKKLIKAYEKIQTDISPDSIKWTTTEIIYDKNGRIEKLEAYRKKRTIKAIIFGFVWMFATTLITGGLFLDVAEIPFWQKLVKLFTYLISIAFSVIFDISKNYEKGAFGVPNELEEINRIWKEFELWLIPEWARKEVEETETLEPFKETGMLDNSVENQEIKEVKIEGNQEVILLTYDSMPEKEESNSERENSVNTRAGVQEKPAEV